jgi:hemin uptake protein HemP
MRPMQQKHLAEPGIHKPVHAARPMPVVVSAATLLRDRRELVIEHDGERYRLSLTKNGKLILTK